jgi:predicted ATPase/DNA-binding SARP family transcriptional activator
MARLEIALLGAFQVIKDGERVTRFETAPTQALLIYLVMHPGMPFRREVLADILWQDQPRSEALHALRQTLNRLRRAIESRESDSPFLQITRQTIQFNPDSDYWLDTDAFTHLVDAVHAHPHRRLGACETCVQQLTQAADLYRGDLLSGFYLDSLPFREWLTMEREHFHRQAIETLYHLADCHNQRREYRQAQHYARRQLELEPWREEAHRQLMVALALSGERSVALAQYESCHHTLTEELGVEPGAETMALYQRIRDGSLRAGATRPHNLPAQLTRFVGRGTELDRIAEQLNDPDCRLLTLVGAGGIGKTRLALQAAGQALDVFADGVCFVSLAAISSPEFLVLTIGEALDYPLSGEVDPKRQLLNYLHQKEMLLVLDNFEHLLSSPGGNDSGRDLLLEMVRMAPRLKLLVTSRERLNLQAERLLTLRGLPYPPAETAFGKETFEAVELFVQGAQRVRPDFTLSAEWPEVVRICRLLEGMPLGIELAATWVSIMPCDEIVRELSRGLDRLSTTLHDVPARHRSMEAVFDHSWQLLSEPERDVFKKLSVFRGGFDRQAAREVAGASLSMLAALVNKSLLRVVSPGRYDMLEPLKQYAAAKLAETPAENEAVQNRHRDYYASFLKQWENDIMKEARQRQALVEITADIDNIRSSWSRTASQGNLEALEKSQESLWSFYEVRGWFQEGNEAFQKAVDGIIETHGEIDELAGENRKVLGQVLVRQGWFCWRLGRYRKCKQVLRQSLACFRHGARDTQGEVGFALSQLGFVEWYMGDYNEAKSLLQESLAIGKETGGWFLTVSFAGLSHVARSLGDYAEAKKWCHEGAALCRERNERRGEVFHLINLAWAANAMGDYAEARQWLHETLVVHKEINDNALLSRSLTQLGTAAYLEGAYAEAKQRHLESVNMSKEIGERWHMALTLIGLGYTTCALGEYEASGRHFREALQTAMEIGSLWMVLDSLVGLARLLTASDPGEEADERAVELLTFVLQHPSSSQEARDRATALLAELEGRLSPAAVAAAKERGQARDLPAIVEEHQITQNET